MFDFIRFVVRNPKMVTKHARRAYKTHKAMQAYRSGHTECAWCGRSKRLDVHHVIPVSVAPEMAASETNMIMLCRKPQCHLIAGHSDSYRDRYVENIRELCEARKVVRTTKAV